MPLRPPQHKPRQWKPYVDTRPNARQRGYTWEWEKASKAYLALPGNELCACGCKQRANMVDHIVAHKGDMRLFWDRSNWQPYHTTCNSKKAALYEGSFGRSMRSDAEGRGRVKSLAI